MNVSKIIAGSHGYEAAGFARSVLANQIGFLLGIAIFAKTKDTPVADARVEAELAEALGFNGLPQRTTYNKEELIDGYAAAFVMLARFVNTPNPDNGRKPEHLIRFLKKPGDLVQSGIDYRLTAQLAQVKASAAMFKADPTKRIAAITAELSDLATTVMSTVNPVFIAALKKYKNAEDSDLVNVCEEVLVNAGRNPATEIKQAVKAYVDSQKKRFEDGGFAQVDSGIYALLTVPAQA